MSDTALGPGWWQAADGRWHPPELRAPPREVPILSPSELAALRSERPASPPPAADPEVPLAIATEPTAAVLPEASPPGGAPVRATGLGFADTPIGPPVSEPLATVAPTVVEPPAETLDVEATVVEPVESEPVAAAIDDFWTADPEVWERPDGDADRSADPAPEVGTDDGSAQSESPGGPLDELGPEWLSIVPRGPDRPIDPVAFEHEDWVSVHSLVYRPDPVDLPEVAPESEEEPPVPEGRHLRIVEDDSEETSDEPDD